MSDSGLSYCSERAGYGTDNEPAVLSPKQGVLDLLSDTEPGESMASGEIEFVNMSSETIKALEKKEIAKQKRRERDQRKRDEKKAAMQDPVQPKPNKRKDLQDANVKKPAIDTHKAKKQRIQSEDEDDEDEDEPRLKVTAYIYIQEPPRPAPRSSGRQKAKAEVTPAIPKGPFFFYTDQSYDDFKRILAKELPCKPKLLPSEHIMWRYEKPANNPKKPLSSISGYEALLISLAGKKAEHVICISMPPPKADSVTWDTGEGDHIEKPYDHYEEVAPLALGTQDLSAKEQIANIASDSGGHRHQLEDQYPIGNCPLFPQMRIYQRIIGPKIHYWELNHLRLHIWANSLSIKKPGVTIQVPPHSAHFDVSACVKPPGSKKPDETPAPDVHGSVPATGAPQVNTYSHYAPPPPWAYGQHPIPGYGPIGPYMYPPPPSHYHPPYGQQPGPITAFQPNEVSISSPGAALRLRVPLADFCARYDISKLDQEKLALLEYRPGNQAILKLEPEDWKGVKFTKLGWTGVIDAHKQFIREVRDGSWVTVSGGLL